MVDYTKDKNNKSIDTSTATIPTNRFFRNAWVLSGSVISEDLTTAKNLFKDKIREVRAPLLDAEDVVYMKALENADTDAQTASKNKKQSLRDAPANSSITNASNITQLINAWDESLLGTNPYK